MAIRDDAGRVTGLLVEYDVTLAARARATADGLAAHLTVTCADAADAAIYADAAPADLVLMCGVFGNISDRDIKRTIEALPQLCATDAQVVWTRHRAEPDVTPRVRKWFLEAGFEEISFVAPDGDTWSVGTHRFAGERQPLEPADHWFTFVR
ncbi:hypothetical protein [Flexivirga caeni]|uniref:hypothetical protein n=1 Tax=Flexivirga caeni TaxID=2294115 RepID=UPI001C6624F2|nr:hypothetical protein [Flexivirga caeni]